MHRAPVAGRPGCPDPGQVGGQTALLLFWVWEAPLAAPENIQDNNMSLGAMLGYSVLRSNLGLQHLKPSDINFALGWVFKHLFVQAFGVEYQLLIRYIQLQMAVTWPSLR